MDIAHVGRRARSFGGTSTGMSAFANQICDHACDGVFLESSFRASLPVRDSLSGERPSRNRLAASRGDSVRR
jgi:hypothetical protein